MEKEEPNCARGVKEEENEESNDGCAIFNNDTSEEVEEDESINAPDQGQLEMTERVQGDEMTCS